MNKVNALLALSDSDSVPYAIGHDFLEHCFEHRVFLAVFWLVQEVNSGGFKFYFTTDAGTVAPFAIEAFRTIGAFQVAKICQRASELVFPNGFPAGEDEIVRLVASTNPCISRILDSLDRDFYGHEDEVTDLLFQYVVDHPHEFGEITVDSYSA